MAVVERHLGPARPRRRLHLDRRHRHPVGDRNTQGGADGRSRWREVATEQQALDEAQHYRDTNSDRWLDLDQGRPGRYRG